VCLEEPIQTYELEFEISADGEVINEPALLVMPFNETVYQKIVKYKNYVIENRSDISCISMCVAVDTYEDKDRKKSTDTECNQLKIHDYFCSFTGYVDQCNVTYSSETIYWEEWNLYHKAMTCPDEELMLYLNHENDNVKRIVLKRIEGNQNG
jgi:hypothetical protein